jgi:hypothetical protein
MRKLVLAGVAGTLLVGAGALLAAPWTTPPPLVYETVMGYPMRVYYRNVGNEPVRTLAVGGLPLLSDAPLPEEKVDGYFAEIRQHLQPSTSMVRGGDFVRFEVNDPEELAWKPEKMWLADQKVTYFYVLAIVEMPRFGYAVHDKWVSELCLVSKTHEPFTRCEAHNAVYSGS